MHNSRNFIRIRGLALLSILVLPVLVFASLGQRAAAATLTSASLQLSDSRPDEQNIDYDFTASNITSTAINCIKVVFATTASGTTAPDDIDTTGAALDNTSDFIPTPSGWTADASTNGTILLTNNSGETPGSSSGSLFFTGIDNGSVSGTTYFMRLNTYANTDCSSSPIDDALLTFVYTAGQNVSMMIDPTLSFTVSAVSASQSVNGATTTAMSTSTTIPFSTVTSSANAVVAQDLTISTNAPHGYSVALRYSGAPTNGTTQIPDHSGSNASPSSFSAAGTEAFGYTTNDATLGSGTAARFISNKWAAATTSDEEVAYSGTAVSNQTTRVGYQAGVSGSTAAGTYITTIIYTATAVY